MTTINADHGYEGWQKFDIDCQDALPISLAFTDNAQTIVSNELRGNIRSLVRYYSFPSDQKNAHKISKIAIALKDVDRAVVSKDGKWIVIISGTTVMVRNMATNEVLAVDAHTSGVPVHAIDVSPDSTKFATGSEDKIVRVFNINTRKLLHELGQHNNGILGVKFSPNCKYLATAASGDHIRVWNIIDSNCYVIFESSSTVNTETVAAQSPIYIPLGWSRDGDCVLTVSSGTLTMFSRPPRPDPWYPKQRQHGPTVVRFQEPVPASDDSTFFSLVTNGRTIACAAGRLLSFWDSFSHSKIGPTITFQDPILSLALSSDSSSLACGRSDKKVTVYLLRDIIPLHLTLDPTCHLPYINVADTIFKPWVEQDLATAERTLTYERELRSCHSLANHALIRAHFQSWQDASEYATKSLAAGPSTIGHIALARALVGQGKQEPAFEAFDAVFRTCGVDENRYLLLIKAILLFISGKRENAITRVKDLICISDDSEKYNCLQVLGNMYLIQGDLKEGFESFECARSLSFFRRGHHLMTILLIFGPSFEERDIALRHSLREAVTPN